MNTRKNFTTAGILLSMIFVFQACKLNDVNKEKSAVVTALNCAEAVFSAAATSGTSFTATASVPYTGGNGEAYEAGIPVASTGINGLTAVLSEGVLANGNGTAAFVISGTPESAGTAIFSIELGGQICTLSLPVSASQASVSSLTGTASPSSGTSGTAYSGTAVLTYTGGNGGAYDVSTAISTGVEGLTATLEAGKLASGSGTLTYTLSGTPTSTGTAVFNLSFGGQTTTVEITVAAGTSGTVTAKDTVVIVYSGTSASVSNAFQQEGVTVTVSGADVTVKSTNTSKEIVYLLSGTATKGSFKLYGEYKFNLTLKGLTLTNSTGPAINIQSGKKATVNIQGVNTLTDGATYATSSEDQKGTFFSEGQLSFMGSGTLNVTGNNKHGIVSDDYIYVSEASINIKSALKDGIHANDYFVMDSGTLIVNATDDGIEVEEGYVSVNGGTLTVNSVDHGIVASYEGTDTSISPYVLIKGGNVNVTTTGEKGNAIKSESYTSIGTAGAVTLSVSGRGSKGVKAGGDFTLTSGTVKITTSGAAFYDTSDLDITAPAGINCDKNLSIRGGTLTVTSTGSGAKGITVDGTVTINGGTTSITASGTKFTYNSSNTSEAKGFKSDGAFTINNGVLNIAATDDGIKSETSITINDGTVMITKSTEGIEAPLITFEGGITNVTASNDGINATKGTVSGGTESNDGSHLYIKGGIVIVAGSDAIDSNGNITISGGTTIVCGPTNQPEEGIDVNGTFLVNGGFLICAGSSSNMTKAMASSSSQVSFYLRSGTQLAASSVIHIEDASGKDLLTYKPKNGVYYFHYSSPSLAKNTPYKIYFGGSYSGGSFVGNSSGWGLYTGGTYSATGATLKASPTTSSSATVNSISF